VLLPLNWAAAAAFDRERTLGWPKCRHCKQGNGQLGRAEKRAAWEEERGVLGLAREGPEGEG